MTGIERLREWAKEVRETARAYRDGEIGYVALDIEACQLQKAAKLEAIADQIEREIDEAVSDEVAGTLSAYEMNADARWHSAVEEGAESDCKAEYELISRYWLPRPRFEDGEPVQFGDDAAVRNDVGEVVEMKYQDGRCVEVTINFEYDSSATHYMVVDGEHVKRPEPSDTWERIEADAKKGYCVYFGRKYTFDCSDGESDACPLSGLDYECEKRKAQDLVRRCKALAGVE